MVKHFFFDLDGTVCESRQSITREMEYTLRYIMENGGDVIIISGAERKRIFVQLENLIPTYILAQSGGDSPFWKNFLNNKEKKVIKEHINHIKENFPQYIPQDGKDLIQDRGCQISISFVGHNANIQEKRKFDPDRKIRKKILAKIKFPENSPIMVKVAGTTCLDYTKKSSTKGKNIKRLLKELNWNKNECIYFGDSLFKGGNDVTVKGIIKTVQVDGPDDLLLKLNKYI